MCVHVPLCYIEYDNSAKLLVSDNKNLEKLVFLQEK